MYIYREEREICCARATAMLYATPESHLCEIEEGRAGEVKEAKQESYGKRVKVSVVMTMFVVCDFFRAFFSSTSHRKPRTASAKADELAFGLYRQLCQHLTQQTSHPAAALVPVPLRIYINPHR